MPGADPAFVGPAVPATTVTSAPDLRAHQAVPATGGGIETGVPAGRTGPVAVGRPLSAPGVNGTGSTRPPGYAAVVAGWPSVNASAVGPSGASPSRRSR